MVELERLEDPSWPPGLHALVRYAAALVRRFEGRFAEARRDFEASRALYLQSGAPLRAVRCQLNVGGVALAMGDVDFALEASRRVADDPFVAARDPYWHMVALGDTLAPLLLKGDAAAARDTFVRVVPLILRYDMGFKYAHRAALLAVLEGEAERAARLIGYGDAAMTARGEHTLEPHEIPVRERVIEYLRSQVPDWSRVEGWMREGATLNDRDAYAHLIGTSA